MRRYTLSDDPTSLFRYQSLAGKGIERFEDMLKNNRIYFASPKDFNDPFDCRRIFAIGNTRQDVVLRYTVYLAKKGRSLGRALKEAESSIPRSKTEVEKWQVERIEETARNLENTGILCLTKSMDSLLMWTHYADSHRGICIRFQAREESHAEFIGSALPVEYADRCPVVNLVKETSRDCVRKVLLTKATPYVHEREWRIVHFNKGAGLKPLPRGIIASVYLGVNIESEMKDRVLKACAAYNGGIEAFVARLDPNTFGLRFEQAETP